MLLFTTAAHARSREHASAREMKEGEREGGGEEGRGRGKGGRECQRTFFMHLHAQRKHTNTLQGKSTSSFSTRARVGLATSRHPQKRCSGTSLPATFRLKICRSLIFPTCTSRPWCARNGTLLSRRRLCSWTLFASRANLQSHAMLTCASAKCLGTKSNVSASSDTCAPSDLMCAQF